jgi:nucleosome binding factor SPN SPT16 subunit
MASIFDRAKKLIDDNDEKIDSAAQKAGDFADDKTGGKYSDKIDSAVDKVQDATGEGDSLERGDSTAR